MIRCCCTLNITKPVFSFCLGLSNSQYSYIKHCFLLLLQILDIFYSICFIILISMIAGNLIEIDFQRYSLYRAENVFRSLISKRLYRRGYQPNTCLNPKNFFLSRCLKCSLPLKPIVSLTFC